MPSNGLLAVDYFRRRSDVLVVHGFDKLDSNTCDEAFVHYWSSAMIASTGHDFDEEALVLRRMVERGEIVTLTQYLADQGVDIDHFRTEPGEKVPPVVDIGPTLTLKTFRPEHEDIELRRDANRFLSGFSKGIEDAVLVDQGRNLWLKYFDNQTWYATEVDVVDALLHAYRDLGMTEEAKAAESYYTWLKDTKSRKVQPAGVRWAATP